MNRITQAIFLAIYSSFSCLVFADPAAPAENKKSEIVKGTINVQAEKKQQMTYGLDFERDPAWSWPHLEQTEKEKLIDLAIKQCQIDYVRVAINGGAETEEGKINWKAYDNILEAMGMMKKVRPDIKFFGSPRPLHVAVKGAPYTCYPLWITPKHPKKKKTQGFFPEKAAGYMVRYVQFMKSKGYKITYIDTKNECCRNLRPGPLAQMVKQMREQLKEDMPIVVAPSSYDYKAGKAWLEETIANKETDFFQIAATHNTKMRGSMDEFSALATKLGKPIWNTECHKLWEGTNQDAVTNINIAFLHIRAGFCGLSNWLTIGSYKKGFKMVQDIEGKLVVNRPYYIYRKWVNSSAHAHYLPSNIAEGLTSNVAFIKDNTMVVWALNANKDKIVDLTVNLAGHQMVSDKIEVTSWGPGEYKEGKVTNIKAAGKGQFQTRIPADSLSCFLFEIK